MKYEIMDGNKACATMSYLFSEVAAIYPITPASTMAENIDLFASNDRRNFWNDKVKVVEMQSEAGAIATVHGLLQNGILATTYTASQGLLLMIPNMYKIAGEMLPCVINVAARTIATHALSIMGDHSDIYATRQTGFAMLASTNVKQAMDMTAVAHLSTIKSRIPFIHFFDGFRTSHEYQKITIPDYEKIKELIDTKALNEFRKRSMNIDNPNTRGTNQGDQIYFQEVEAKNKYYEALPDIVNNYMQEINKINNTNYQLFNYYGDENATKVIVAMGSVCDTIKEVIDHNKKGIGLIEVHLYRPLSKKYFLSALPKTTQCIAVLDRTKEAGATGEPLYLDVVDLIKSENLDIEVYGGRYGLSSKDTTPNDIEAIYNYLERENKNNKFTIGINDDVTNLSLKPTTTNFSKNQTEILIYGYGSDGMITTSKNIITIVGEKTNKFIQGYFEYDSKKSGGVTKSHLRFSNNEIKSRYYVTNPKVIICTKDTYLKKYDVLKGITENGLFILNTEKTKEELPEIIPSEDIKTLKEKNIDLYIINASKIARENNIPNKISMIMEMAILKLTNLIDFTSAKSLVEEAIIKNFKNKGEDIVNSNINATKDAIENLEKINVSELTSNINKEATDNTVFSMLDHGKGNELPVSSFIGKEDGIFEPGLSKSEKRGISSIVPSYSCDKCISCNFCSLVCPHGVIRPYLLTKEELENAPESIKKNAKDARIPNQELYFTIGISPLDCTGCGLCASICPTLSITMKELKNNESRLVEEYTYLESLPKKNVLPKNTIKGSQFETPKFQFSGACAGCGETPYLKLLTQLFGDNLMIANATGCSSIYSSSLPSTPYDIPWANSLFEDNAEFGYGMRVAEDFMQNKIKRILEENKDKLSSHNQELITAYLNNENNAKDKLYTEFNYDELPELEPLKKFIKDKSIWLVGGDGWAYDIGFGGIDHVLANKENINILVLDTEVYSNTGGQASKSTRLGAVAKFAASGKTTAKKDLASIALTYPHVYVGTVSLGANFKQTIDTFVEANNYDGPSIIIAYAPCIAHGIKKGMVNSIQEEKLVAQSGYFPLFRYNPTTKQFKMDSKADFSKYEEVLEKENRYRIKTTLLEENKENAIKRYEKLENMNKN